MERLIDNRTAALRQIERQTSTLKIFGSYPRYVMLASQG